MNDYGINIKVRNIHTTKLYKQTKGENFMWNSEIFLFEKSEDVAELSYNYIYYDLATLLFHC